MSAYTRQLAAAARQYESESAYDEDDELADERRDEYIAKWSAESAKKLVGAEDFAWGALVDLPRGAAAAVLQDAGRFFERFHNAHDDPSTLASIAIAFYRDLLPYIEAAAKEQAESEVAAEYDKPEAA